MPKSKSSGSTDANPFFNIARKTGSNRETSSSRTTRTTTSNTTTNLSTIGGSTSTPPSPPIEPQDDSLNYALLIALYTLQGIPMGLSASIPFLIQQKVKVMAEALAASAATTAAANAASAGATAAASAASAASSSTAASASITKMAYNAQAIFALCSWPFSLKLLWAPIVDAIYIKGFGRRKSWLVPVQLIASCIMIFGSNYVETQLGLGVTNTAATATAATNAASDLQHFDVKGVTAFFFILYFLMATQDIAVDGWALTMLSRRNRGRGPVCNSIGQNLGYFLAFVGFLALNDPESSEKLWRPLLGLKSDPTRGLVSLGSFIKFMGFVMLAITTLVAIFKKEMNSHGYDQVGGGNTADNNNGGDDDDAELDASQIGLAETYHRLWSVCKLPAVRWLFLVLLTYRFPTALSDKVKFLKVRHFIFDTVHVLQNVKYHTSILMILICICMYVCFACIILMLLHHLLFIHN